MCHHVLVHPPGGVVAGDRLDIEVALGEGAHALLTTPGATRFYRSDGRVAAQRAPLVVAEGARLEWLPLEAIAYPGCDAVNEVGFDLAPGAEIIGWDLLALGLPAAGAPFASGRFAQQLHWPGHWLERGTLRADDAALLDGPLGLAGVQQHVLAVLVELREHARQPDDLGPGACDGRDLELLHGTRLRGDSRWCRAGPGRRSRSPRA